MTTTISDKKKPLPVDRVCRIIESCGKSGVKVFSHGDLRIEFMGGENSEPNYMLPLIPEAKGNSEEPFLEAEQESKQHQIDQMLIEDPEKYEEMQTRGELEDEKD